MSRLQALQFLYASVEKDESPRGLVGYQTLYYTRSGLEPKQVQEWESHLTYFPAPDSPAKFVFFILESGAVVLAKISRLTEPDRHGRLRALAHGLVFPAEARFEAVRQLFGVLAQFPFIGSLSQALAAGERQTGNLPAVTIELTEPGAAVENLVQTWPAEVLRQLVFLALRAARLQQEHLALAIVGTPDDILGVLQWVQFCLPAELFLPCSFDTFFIDDKGTPLNLLANYCWAVGLPHRPRQPEFIVVDTAHKRVEYETVWRPASLFEAWLDSQLTPPRTTGISRHKADVLAISQFLAGQPVPTELLDRIDMGWAGSLTHELPSAFQADLARFLEQWLPRSLAVRLAAYLVRHVDFRRWWCALRNEMKCSAWLDWLWQAYRQSFFQAPGPDEIETLQPILRAHPHPLLALLPAVWQPQKGRLDDLVRALSREDYLNCVQWALHHGYPQPWSWWARSRAREFVEVWQRLKPRPALPLPDLVDELIAADAVSLLDHFIPLIEGQSSEVLRQVQKSIKRIGNVPVGFQQALTQKWQQALAQESPINRWRHRLMG